MELVQAQSAVPVQDRQVAQVLAAPTQPIIPAPAHRQEAVRPEILVTPVLADTKNRSQQWQRSCDRIPSCDYRSSSPPLRIFAILASERCRPAPQTTTRILKIDVRSLAVVELFLRDFSLLLTSTSP